jgi:uncharacterized protein (TIGR02452 family)
MDFKDNRRSDKFRKTAQHFKSHLQHKNHRYVDQNLVNVWNDTKNYFVKNPKPISPSTKINIWSLNEVLDDPKIVNNCVVEVLNEDSFNLGIRYISEGLNPLVLNMASDFKPGGGVANGKTAQEEELFRRSNAHLTHPNAWYPLSKDEIIYSPEVTIIKDTRNNDYALIDEVKVAMIAVAAIRRPKLVYGSFSKDDYDLMSNKIEAMFMVGIEKKHDALVLGAFGCGAFHNPPGEVAEIFSVMVDKYGKYFKKIGFAVLTVKSTDNDNLEAFREAFKK